MRKTIIPDVDEYNSILRDGLYQTNYGEIYSYSDGDWYQCSHNEEGSHIGECFFRLLDVKHYYDIRL